MKKPAANSTSTPLKEVRNYDMSSVAGHLGSRMPRAYRNYSSSRYQFNDYTVGVLISKVFPW